MRSQSNGPVATFLMLAPLLAVPLLAVFGVPQLETEKSSESKDKQKAEKSVDLGKEESDDSGFNADEIFETSKTLDDPDETTALDSPFHQHDSSAQVPVRYANNTAPKSGLDGWELANGSPKGDRLRVTSETNSNNLTERFRSLDANELEKEFAAESEKPFRAQPGKSGRPQRPNSSRTLPKSNAGNRETSFNSVNNKGSAMASIAPGEDAENPFTQFEQESNPSNNAGKNTPAAGTIAPPATWAAAVNRLNKLGIRDFQLKPGARPNEFLFLCSFTPADNPRITHRFEAEAAEPLRAVQKVVVQVEEWMQRR